MKRLVIASLMALSASIFVSDTASAYDGFGFPYSMFGFGGPVARFGGIAQTPPYFATNPPVYYGSRYARPYGISPYAAPPVVNAPAGYEGGPAARFYYPPTPPAAPLCNPYICGQKSDTSQSSTPKLAAVGEIRTNPFVDSTEHLAKK